MSCGTGGAVGGLLGSSVWKDDIRIEAKIARKFLPASSLFRLSLYISLNSGDTILA